MAGAHGFIGYASNTTMLYGSHSFELDYSQVRRARIDSRHLVLRLITSHAVTTLQSLCLSLPEPHHGPTLTPGPAPHDR